MDAVKSFFAKYNAVPATDAGIDWPLAKDEAVIGWLTGELALLRRGEGDPKRVILKQCIAEAWKRIGRMGRECANQPKDWPGRDIMGRMLAQIAMHADLLTITVNKN